MFSVPILVHRKSDSGPGRPICVPSRSIMVEGHILYIIGERHLSDGVQIEESAEEVQSMIEKAMAQASGNAAEQAVIAWKVRK